MVDYHGSNGAGEKHMNLGIQLGGGAVDQMAPREEKRAWGHPTFRSWVKECGNSGQGGG